MQAACATPSDDFRRTRVETGTLVFLDMVESVRLMEQDEEETVRRWMDLVAAIRDRVMPRHAGEVLKFAGDGLILRLPSAHAAVAACLQIREITAAANAGRSPDGRILLRMAASTGTFYRGPADFYGRAVNLGARLLSAAGPDEILVSEETRGQLSEGIDAELEDLGALYLRNVAEPVRAWRVGPPADPRALPAPAAADPRPTIAVMPFEPRGDEGTRMVGEVVADVAIRMLSAIPTLNVISRLSTSALAGRRLSAPEIGAALSADYVVAGSFRVRGHTLHVDAELVDAQTGAVLWSERFSGSPEMLYDSSAELVAALAGRVTRGVELHEVAKSRRSPMPTLKGSTLLLSAVNLLHRLSPQDLERARELLETLVERSPRQSLPLAWLAYWHVMRVKQGWSRDPARDAALATDASARALDADPESPVALVVSGSVNANLLRRLDVAEQRYDAALATSPSDSLAWLLRAAARAFAGRGEEAVENAHRAIRLSPCDPHRYLYDSIAASAHLVAGDDGQALAFAEASLRANRLHASTLRVKAVAEWRMGLESRARATAAEMMALAPGFTVSGYIATAPIADARVAEMMAEALRAVGAPE